jgi:hypothetical protein
VRLGSLVALLCCVVVPYGHLSKEDQVISKSISAVMVALVATAALAVTQTADAGQPQDPPRSAPQTPTATSDQPATTLVGCLYREDQVPGRKPNVAERAGVLEDYILADASRPTSQPKPGATPGATGTSGTAPATGNMYKVEGPSDEQLKALVGKKVEVKGRIDPEGGPGAAPGAPKPDRGLGPDQINLPEFEASSVREISGTCPAAPAPRK